MRRPPRSTPAFRLRLLPLALVATLGLSGCGGLLIMRMGQSLVKDRNEGLQKQRAAEWPTLHADLQALCRAEAATLPSPAKLPLPAEGRSVVFDTQTTGEPEDRSLVPPDDVLGMLNVGRTQRAAVAVGEPLAEGDYAVTWRRTPKLLPGTTLPELELLTMQVSDRSGRVLAQDTQLVLQWLGGWQFKYLSCFEVMRPAEAPVEGEIQPELVFLKEAFGVRNLAIRQAPRPPALDAAPAPPASSPAALRP